MTQEHNGRPGWAEFERKHDLAWIAQNLNSLWPAAQLGHVVSGRGAIYIDATDQVAREDYTYWYASQDVVGESGDAAMIRMVAEYDPRLEMVTVFFKSNRRVSTYRIGVVGM